MANLDGKIVSNLESATEIKSTDLFVISQSDSTTGKLVSKKITYSLVIGGLDDDVVHLDGAETITGIKTFSAPIIATGGLEDANVTTSILLGDSSNTSLTTTNKTIVGGINELKTDLDTLDSDKAPLTSVVNTIFVDISYTGTIQNGSQNSPYTSIMDAINAIPALDVSSSTDKYVAYKIYVYSGFYDEDITFPGSITPRIIHFIARGPVYLGLMGGTDRNITYNLNRPEEYSTLISSPALSFLVENEYANDGPFGSSTFNKKSSWTITGDFLIGDVSNSTMHYAYITLQNVNLLGNFAYSSESNNESQFRVSLYGCYFSSIHSGGTINFPYTSGSDVYGSVFFTAAEKCYFGTTVITYAFGRIDNCIFNSNVTTQMLSSSENNIVSITNTQLPPYFTVSNTSNCYIDPQSRLLTGVDDLSTISSGITWTDHFVEAASGVTFGHINDSAQTIAGAKTLSSALTITSGLKDPNVTTAILLGDTSNTSFTTTNKTIVGAVNEISEYAQWSRSSTVLSPKTSGDSVTVNSTTEATSSAGAIYTVGGIATASNIYVNSTTAATSSAGAIYTAGGITTASNVYVNSTTEATSSAGSIYTAGGLTAAKKIYVNDATDAASGAGAIETLGGVSAAKSLYAGTGIYLPVATGGTQTLLNRYEGATSFSSYLTGPFASSTYTIYLNFHQIGQICFCDFPTLASMTGNASTTSIAVVTTIPSRFYPTTDRSFPVMLYFSSTYVWARFKVSSAGAITIVSTTSAGTFAPGSNSITIEKSSFHWQVNN